MSHEAELQVAVIGAGPVGLAAAAHLVSRGIPFVILECGEAIGASIREWNHVRVFSPWRYNIDAASGTLLERSGWHTPDPDDLPTGAEILRDYLEPLAALPEIAQNLHLGSRVTAVTRKGFDKVRSLGRDRRPFFIRFVDGEGIERALPARAVIDASGTWTSPNPLGTDGLPAIGEEAAAGRIAYGIPDVTGAERDDYAGKRVLVIGSGHSAINVALALLELQDSEPSTRIFWALRRNRIEKLIGGGQNDRLPARGALGLAAKQAIEQGKLEMLAPFAAESVKAHENALVVDALLGDHRLSLEVDRVVVAAGFRPDLSFLRELRILLDPVIEAPPALAPLIDPNLHSCGTVPPHGIDELAHQEPGFFIVGSKSYGRAPTFLMATGYEQVRSVVADIAGDHKAAREVHLVKPETGICSTDSAGGRADDSGGCCGGPAPSGTNACCVADAEAKAEGRSGCGCGSPKTSAEASA